MDMHNALTQLGKPQLCVDLHNGRAARQPSLPAGRRCVIAAFGVFFSVFSYLKPDAICSETTLQLQDHYTQRLFDYRHRTRQHRTASATFGCLSMIIESSVRVSL